MVRHSHTERKQTKGGIIEEETDVACTLGHDVEGVCDGAGEGEHAAGEHVAEQRPGVGIVLEIQRLRQTLQHPHEVPAGQKVRPEVEGLVGGVKQAQDALPGRGLGVAVPGHDEVLLEVFGHLVLVVQWAAQAAAGEGGGGEHGDRRGGVVPEWSTVW